MRDFNTLKNRKYLHNSDFTEDGTELTIKYLTEESVRQKNGSMEDLNVMFFEEKKKGFIINWTNIQSVSRMVSKDVDKWTGGKVTLYKAPYNDSDTGEPGWCIRIKEDLPF